MNTLVNPNEEHESWSCEFGNESGVYRKKIYMVFFTFVFPDVYISNLNMYLYMLEAIQRSHTTLGLRTLISESGLLFEIGVCAH